jgi:2-hydroxychromene-2-carboxylate isomerase
MVMKPTIEFLFDFASPNVYLAARALPPVLERTGATLTVTPCLLGGVFKATNNKSPIVAFAPVKGKVEYEMLEIRRFIERHKLTKFRMNPHFPVNTLMLMRGFVAACAAGHEAPYREMGLRGMWEDGLKLDDPDVLKGAIDAVGLDGASLLAAAQTDGVKQMLADNTAAAVARGVFGLPAFFVGKELFWGKERLGQVEDAAMQSAA